MELVFAITIGILYATGAYMLLRRSVVKLIIGVLLISQAANLLLFTAHGLTWGEPAFIPEGADAPPPGVADPLPQALILTAIVISFGVLAFTLVMVQQAKQAIGTDDLDELKSTDSQ